GQPDAPTIGRQDRYLSVGVSAWFQGDRSKPATLASANLTPAQWQHLPRLGLASIALQSPSRIVPPWHRPVHVLIEGVPMYQHSFTAALPERYRADRMAGERRARDCRHANAARRRALRFGRRGSRIRFAACAALLASGVGGALSTQSAFAASPTID